MTLDRTSTRGEAGGLRACVEERRDARIDRTDAFEVKEDYV